jgi:aminocarboxymuconate-semialdehyde decarboxylase
MKRINAHGHLLPYPEEIPAFMREQRIFWVDSDRKIMRQGDWTRPVTDPSFFLEEKLEWMATHRIDHTVLITLSQLYCNGLPRVQTDDVVRFQNDYHATVQEKHPHQFTGGFVVQPAYMEDALRECRRCVEDLKLKVLCLPTHFLDTAGEWTTVAHPDTEPLWELADHYELAVEIHPYDAEKMVRLKDQFWRFHLIWMCAQTADAYHFYTLYNLPERYPGVRVCFAHGNQFGQMNTGRRRQGFEGRPDLFPEAVHPDRSLGATNVFFDTLVHDPLSLRLLIERQGATQIVAGLDDPYPLGEMETVPGCYPGKVIDETSAAGWLTEAEVSNIWCDNVLKWLYPNQTGNNRTSST